MTSDNPDVSANISRTVGHGVLLKLNRIVLAEPAEAGADTVSGVVSCPIAEMVGMAAARTTPTMINNLCMLSNCGRGKGWI